MKTLSLLLVTCGLLVTSGCGMLGSGGAADPTASTMPEAEILAIGKELATCLRENGVPQFPDPYVEDGRIMLPEGVEEQLEQQVPEDVRDRALETCQHIMDRLPEAAVKGEDGPTVEEVPRPPTAEDLDKLREFAKCMRENGVPDWPDPKADGSFPLAGSPIEAEGKSARIVAGFEACGHHYDGKLVFS
jgi:hypothetical protein